jgi:hypothetical protein
MKKTVSNFLLGFLAGAAAGAIAGILFAPEKGSTTRQNIKKKVRELSDEYDLGLGDLMDELGLEAEPEQNTKASSAKRKPGTPKSPTPAKRKYAKKPKPENQ